MYPDQGYPATVWRGLANDSTHWSYSIVDSIVWVVRETSASPWNDALFEPFNTPDPVPESASRSTNGARYFYLGVENPTLVLGYASFNIRYTSYNGSGSSAPVLKKAETCIITPCERTYQLSVTAGQLHSVVIDTDYGVSEILKWAVGAGPANIKRCWRTTSYRGTDVEDCDFNPKGGVTGCYGGAPTSGDIFCSVFGDRHRLGARGVELLGREGTQARQEGEFTTYGYSDRPGAVSNLMGMGFQTDGKTTTKAIQAHNFSYLVERMAASMTKAELDNSSTLVYGNMTSPVVHVEVAWPWFILPAALNVLAILLLLATAVLSHHRKTQLWKSSSLALLYHGLDDPEPAPDLGLARVSEMERWASATSATLGPVKDGGRAVLKTLPRGQASKD
jgi:hypothetical protein